MPNSLISPEIATVRAAIAPLLSDAKASASTTSQLIRGHRAEVLEKSGNWRKIVGVDGYPGWCHEGYLQIETGQQQLADLAAHTGWRSPERLSLGCVIETPDYGHVQLPLGAVLGEEEKVVSGLAMNLSGRERYFAPTPESLVERAKVYFAGSPYLWGGVTPWGADCSGIVQTMFALHGIQLPRDAWQQAEVGMGIETDAPTDFHPADLLFFSDRPDGKITHVAIAISGGVVMHNSLANGGFGINDLTATDKVAQNLRATFRSARRIF